MDATALPVLSARGDAAADPYARPAKTFTYEPQKPPTLRELLWKWLNPIGWIDAMFDSFTAILVYLYVRIFR